MLGAGRIATITTEAVALSSGFDRRVTAIYAIWQALLPLIFFTLAIVISRLQIHRRTINPIVKKTARKEAITHDVLPRKPRHP
ncbi:Inner membrane ABC transporter permease protein YnjC [Grimontia marina]|nr:Inner membrane ABC transporter permease protein YnjC [Grimontia marina]